ncbi:hypothetical protein LJB97_00270 [Parabacteroides sp. OttesenSCG-928-O15]|nr:hypothetical protein [Parabacteroides sp. OttesenSCG-928-O15]
MEQTNIFKIKSWHLAVTLILLIAGVNVVGATKLKHTYELSDIEQLKTLREGDFSEVVSSGTTCILFYQNDDEISKEMEQNLIHVKEEYEGRIHFYKMDATAVADKNISTRIVGTPSILIFKNGTDKAGIMGHSSVANIRKIINKCQE